MEFPEAISAQLAKKAIRVAPLLRFDFLSGTQRYWLGFRPLHTQDGNDWVGAGHVASIGDISTSINGTATEQTFTVSGVTPEFVSAAQAAKEEYSGRLCFVYFQFFDEDWSVLDSAVAFWWGRMYSLTAAQQPDDDGFVRTITLSAETFFSNRKRPRYGYLTDRDQQLRYPGDKGCERVMGMQNKLIKYPDY